MDPTTPNRAICAQRPDGTISLAAFGSGGGLYISAPHGAVLSGDLLEGFADVVANALDDHRAHRETIAHTPPEPARKDCPSCKGTGSLKSMGSQKTVCPVCDGEGTVIA